MPQWRTEEILILVKAYPNPSQKYVEASCVAGITKTGNWIRLYPVKFRHLEQRHRFRKWQWIQAKVTKNTSDPRPESYKADHDSIQPLDVVSTENQWARRWGLIRHLQRRSIEDVCSEYKQSGTSLAMVKPHDIELYIEESDPEWTHQQISCMRQMDMFSSQLPRTLEKIPYDFRYRFHCGTDNCNGHSMKIVDWEIYQSYRRWRRNYGDKWRDMILDKYQNEMRHLDLHFFIGNMHRFPTRWIIIGLFYPPQNGISQPHLLRA